LPLSLGVESGRRAVAGRRVCALDPAAGAQQPVIPSGAVVGVRLCVILSGAVVGVRLCVILSGAVVGVRPACHPERSEPKASVVEGSRARRMAGWGSGESGTGRPRGRGAWHKPPAIQTDAPATAREPD